jgi:hypothetical protein
MSEVNLEDLGFKPSNKPPTLFSFYGIGTRLYGSLKKNEYPNLSVRIVYFTLFFIPIFALGRYLIQQHEGNEYVVGKSSLSGLSKIWNSLLGLTLVTFSSLAYYQHYTQSADYIAAQNYQVAEQAIAEKDYTVAFQHLISVYRGNSAHQIKARDLIDRLAEDGNLHSLTAAQSYSILENLAKVRELFPNLEEKYISYFERYQADYPKEAVQLARLIVKDSPDEALVQNYNQKSYQLLQQVFANNTGDLDLAIQYAELEESLNQCAQCLSILQPYRAQLGGTEGARILGQALAGAMEYDLAYELLLPYVKLRLEWYHRAEQKYSEVLDKTWQDTIEYLDTGKAPQSFYDDYQAADEETQSQLVNAVYERRRDGSVQVTQARDAYLNSTKIVPVALDLGIVMLNRALNTSDPAAREASLKSAEETFLSVRNFAGDSDEYQLYLGQVYYWLGKESEGEALFAALIEKYQRSHQVLYSLSGTLRDLGAFSTAREYALEAYESASEIVDKQRYAQTLSLLAEEMDDKIAWLEKADQSSLYIKGDLLTTKGRKAADENRNEAALKFYQQAIDVYKKIPQDATQLNNIALIYQAKYSIGFQASDFNQSLESLDKAIALVPEDSIVLLNAANQHFEKAYSDILSPFFNFKSLKESPSLEHFYFLYQTEQQKAAFRTQLAEHSSFKKALSYTQKGLLIAPKNAHTLGNLYSIYVFMDMQDEITQLAQRFDSITLDIESQRAAIADYRNGVDQQKILVRYQGYVDQYQQKLTSNKVHQLNQTAIRSGLLSTQIALAEMGQRVDADAIVKTAELNYRVKPSSSTRSDLERALIAKIIARGIKQSDSFAQFYQQFEKVISSYSLLAIGMETLANFRQQVLQSAEKQRLENLMIEGFSAFPTRPGINDWVLLHQFASPVAEAVKKALLADPLRPAKKVLYEKMSANREQVTVMQLFDLMLEGKMVEAKTLNRQAIAEKLLVPELTIGSAN